MVLQRSLRRKKNIKSWALRRWIQDDSSGLDMDNNTLLKKQAPEMPPRRLATQGRTNTSPFTTKPQLLGGQLLGGAGLGVVQLRNRL